MRIERVAVFCGSSRHAHKAYLEAAQKTGEILASKRLEVTCGGGAHGLMGALADSIVRSGGRIIGIRPKQLLKLEQPHQGLTELIAVDNMRDRKTLLVAHADAVIALPGGCGTFDELIEVISLKRLGLFLGPIIIVNVRGFFKPFLQQLDLCVAETFLSDRHRAMWTTVAAPEEIWDAVTQALPWTKDSTDFALL